MGELLEPCRFVLTNSFKQAKDVSTTFDLIYDQYIDYLRSEQVNRLFNPKAPRNWTKVQYFTYVKHVHFIHFWGRFPTPSLFLHFFFIFIKK